MMMDERLKIKYLFAKTIVLDSGFQDEINWQSTRNFNSLNERDFLRETAWVILTSGMRESIIRKIFSDISTCFFKWDRKKIVQNMSSTLLSALKIFNNKPKIFAILDVVKRINDIGFLKLKKKIQKNPLETLADFSYIGPITVYHLAKNIGLPLAKPDRHLVRIAQMEKYTDVQQFCCDISKLCGDSISVVDIVLWRFATLEPNYLKVLSSLNCYQDHTIENF
jgi:hypothetical protein